MKVESRESRVKSRAMHCFALSLAMVLPAAIRSQAQCYIDPVTGERVCAEPPQSIPGGRAPALDSRLSTLDHSAHCRISVADGSTGSGTLIAVDDSVGLVLTCSHLFDTSADHPSAVSSGPNGIVATFPNGSRFAARLIHRDPAHDLAALSIRRPTVEPLVVSDDEPAGLLTACGFGPSGQFRGIRGHIVGYATSGGALYPSLTMSGAARPGDSGGAVLNAWGQLIGVVWGQRDGCTYATCGRPVREFLASLRGKQFVANPKSRRDAPNLEWQAWSTQMESRLRALDEKKQDKGDYLRAGDLNGYLRLDSFKSLAARFDSMQEHVEQIATAKGGLFQGLSFSKLIVGALGLSGPLAAAVLIAGGLAGRRAKKRLSIGGKIESSGGEDAPARRPPLIAVDTPPPPQQTVPETHYVPVEQDSFAKAHQWSSEHIARKYPGATEILQAQDSLIKQYLAAN